MKPAVTKSTKGIIRGGRKSKILQSRSLQLLKIEPKAIVPKRRAALANMTLLDLAEGSAYQKQKLHYFLQKLPAPQRARIKKKLQRKSEIELEVANKYLEVVGLDPNSLMPEARWRRLRSAASRGEYYGVGDGYNQQRLINAINAMLKEKKYAKCFELI